MRHHVPGGVEVPTLTPGRPSRNLGANVDSDLEDEHGDGVVGDAGDGQVGDLFGTECKRAAVALLWGVVPQSPIITPEKKGLEFLGGSF